MSSPAPAQIAPEISRILFATDFSACSRAALPYARALAERYGSTVHVVHSSCSRTKDRDTDGFAGRALRGRAERSLQDLLHEKGTRHAARKT